MIMKPWLVVRKGDPKERTDRCMTTVYNIRTQSLLHRKETPNWHGVPEGPLIRKKDERKMKEIPVILTLDASNGHLNLKWSKAELRNIA